MAQDDAARYEQENVHAVYESIASHFSATRYKPWPLIEKFLASLAPGSIGVDVGCGNGKYLPIRKDVFIIGSDRSTNLVKIAKQHEPHDVIVGDCLNIPHVSGTFDFSISIAVIHHLSTRERRIAATKAILELLNENGKATIYVWALEQESSRRGWKEGGEQDVMVPWVKKTKGMPDQTFERYYHLYVKGELEEDIVAAGGEVVESGYEKDNWWVIARRG